VAVVASCGGASPEVMGDAGYLLSTTKDHKALAETLFALLDSPSERVVLKEKGMARAADFSWEMTATKTLALYEVYTRRH
jgi:glycosyltransferase involved in cell wall biosynthesis